MPVRRSFIHNNWTGNKDRECLSGDHLYTTNGLETKTGNACQEIIYTQQLDWKQRKRMPIRRSFIHNNWTGNKDRECLSGDHLYTTTGLKTKTENACQEIIYTQQLDWKQRQGLPVKRSFIHNNWTGNKDRECLLGDHLYTTTGLETKTGNTC